MKRAARLMRDEIAATAVGAFALGIVCLFVLGVIAVGYLYVRAISVVPR